MVRKYPVPSGVEGKAKAAGEAGLRWLENLDALVDSLAAQWNISLGSVINGGTHALVVEAVNGEGVACVLKVEIPDTDETEFMRGVSILQAADGHGYARMYACDVGNRAVLLERLGMRMRLAGIPARRQMEILCAALEDTWLMKLDTTGLPDGSDSIAWFREFIPEAWKLLNRPCSERVIAQAMRCLDAREEKLNPAEYVILHGDAHNNNALQTAEGGENFTQTQEV